MIAFQRKPILEYIDGRRWKLAAPFWFKYVAALESCAHEVPAGFVHDFSSIPRFFWRLALPTEYGEAGIIHDYLYYAQSVSRAGADRAYLEALEQLGCPSWKRRAMWTAVRLFGSRAYGKPRTAEV